MIDPEAAVHFMCLVDSMYIREAYFEGTKVLGEIFRYAGREDVTERLELLSGFDEVYDDAYEASGNSERSAYGKQLMQELSSKLTIEFGKGFSERNLQMMRKFYFTFPIPNALRSELSWTHYRELMRVADKSAREFYLEEAIKEGWSSRQLQRQINTLYYNRILASKDKESVAAEIQTTEPKPGYEQIIKDPYVLEFLNLPPNEHYYESDITGFHDTKRFVSADRCRR